MSLNNKFYSRLNFQSICEFLQNGYACDPKQGTLYERQQQCERELEERLQAMLERINREYGEAAKAGKVEFWFEDVCSPVYQTVMAIEELNFQVGVMAGLHLYPQFQIERQLKKDNFR